ncbi:MAG: D-aminoacyl-tRNA deacylase [Candidatus Woesearchaeota archaeon]
MDDSPMRIAVIASTRDPAGMNIKDKLLEQGFEETEDEFDGHKVYVFRDAERQGDSGPGEEEAREARLYTTDTDSVKCENIDERISETGFRPDLLIFATKHAAESGIRSLSVHVQGNWGRADLGGRERQLCIAPASYLRAALLKLDELNEQLSGQEGDKFSVIQECTHHGPYVETPSMFIEIGSKDPEWRDPEAGRIIARTIISLIREKPTPCRAIFGIGGMHHTPEFSKIIRRKDYAVGHVCPKYAVESLDRDMIRQAIERTSENNAERGQDVMVVLDWKGLPAGKERITAMLDELGISFRKTKELT